MALTSQQLKGQKKLHSRVCITVFVLLLLAFHQAQGIILSPCDEVKKLKSSFLTYRSAAKAKKDAADKDKKKADPLDKKEEADKATKDKIKLLAADLDVKKALRDLAALKDALKVDKLRDLDRVDVRLEVEIKKLTLALDGALDKLHEQRKDKFLIDIFEGLEIKFGKEVVFVDALLEAYKENEQNADLEEVEPALDAAAAAALPLYDEKAYEALKKAFFDYAKYKALADDYFWKYKKYKDIADDYALYDRYERYFEYKYLADDYFKKYLSYKCAADTKFKKTLAAFDDADAFKKAAAANWEREQKDKKEQDKKKKDKQLAADAQDARKKKKACDMDDMKMDMEIPAKIKDPAKMDAKMKFDLLKQKDKDAKKMDWKQKDKDKKKMDWKIIDINHEQKLLAAIDRDKLWKEICKKAKDPKCDWELAQRFYSCMP